MPRFKKVQSVTTKVDQSARWRIDSAVSARPQSLVNHAQKCNQQSNAQKPSRYLNQLYDSSNKSFDLLDDLALNLAMHILRDTKGNFNTITYRAALQKVAREMQVGKRA